MVMPGNLRARDLLLKTTRVSILALLASTAALAQTATPTASPTQTPTVTPTVTATPTITPTTTPVPTFNPGVCYAVPDSTDNLVSVNPATGVASVLGPTGAGTTIQGLAAAPTGGTLYAATRSQLGSVNIGTGAYTAIGSFGTPQNGLLGPITLDGIVSLTFSGANGNLYGVHRTSLDPDLCYAYEATTNRLVTIDRTTGDDTNIGVSSNGIEALALVGSTLYAAIGDQLGVVQRTTGTFSARAATFGQGDPGPVGFDDIRGLTFDPVNFVLYASHREAGGDDLLFIVDMVTGAHVPLQFNGGTDDYATISGGTCVSPVDIEDIAIDPTGSTLYGSNGTDLVEIDPATGACNVIGDFANGGPPITIAGLGFDTDGVLYGTDDDEDVYEIDTATGEATPIGSGLSVGTDYRALDCPVAVPDILVRINPSTGAYVPLQFSSQTYDYALIDDGAGGCGTEVGGLAYNRQDDTLYAIDETNGELLDVDEESGFCFANFVNPLGFGDLRSLTYSPSTNRLLAGGNSNLYVVDTLTGAASVVGPFGAGTNYEALECPTTGCNVVVRKRHTGIPYSGSNITYRLFWLNPCQGISFSNVVLQDALPTGLSLVSATSTAATVQTFGNSVTLTDALLTNGPAQFATIRANITAAAGSKVTNTLSARDNFGRVFSAADTIKVREPRTNGELDLDGQSKSAPGKSVTYTARYREIAAGNTLVLTVPAAMEVVKIAPDPSSIAGNVITWNNLPTPAGGVRVRTRVLESLSAATVATATATLTDANGADLEDGVDTVITLPPPTESTPAAAALDVEFSVPKQVTAGLVTTLRLKYSGLQAAGSLATVLPAELTVQQTVPEASVAGNTVTWSNLTAASGTVQIKALVAADAGDGRLLSLSATLSSGSNSANDAAQMFVRP